MHAIRDRVENVETPESQEAARGGPTRRRLLSALGGGVAAGLAAGAVLPGVGQSPRPGNVASSGVDTETEPAAESAAPYAVWQYKPADGDVLVRPTSPINLVFPLDDRSFADLVSVFRTAGWYDTQAEYVRYAWDRARERYTEPDYTGTETQIGVAGRLHVRCWELDGTASVQAHVDTPALPKHGIQSYATARAAVEQLFRDAGWTVDENRRELGNDKRPDHDGQASVIRR